MSKSPEILAVVRNWAKKADHDLRNAEHTLELSEDCPYDTVCFHAQQGVEKYLKALLTLRGIDFPKTHDLTELVVLLSEQERDKIEMPDLAELNPYAIEGRYPGDWESQGRGEAERALEIAQKIREIIRNLISLDMGSA